MTGVVTQFHKAYPACAKTKIKVVFVPWRNRATDWTTAARGRVAVAVKE